MVPGAKKCLGRVMVTVTDGGTWVFAKDILLRDWAHCLFKEGTNLCRLTLHHPCHSGVPIFPSSLPHYEEHVRLNALVLNQVCATSPVTMTMLCWWVIDNNMLTVFHKFTLPVTTSKEKTEWKERRGFLFFFLCELIFYWLPVEHSIRRGKKKRLIMACWLKANQCHSRAIFFMTAPAVPLEGYFGYFCNCILTKHNNIQQMIHHANFLFK